MPRAKENMPRPAKRRTRFVTVKNMALELPLVSTAVPLVSSGVLPRMTAEIPLVSKRIPLVSAPIPLVSAHLPITLPRHWGFLPSRQWGRTGLPKERKLTVDRPTDVGGILGKVLTLPIRPMVGTQEVHRVETSSGPGLVYGEREKQETLLKELEEYRKTNLKLFRKSRKRSGKYKGYSNDRWLRNLG